MGGGEEPAARLALRRGRPQALSGAGRRRSESRGKGAAGPSEGPEWAPRWPLHRRRARPSPRGASAQACLPKAGGSPTVASWLQVAAEEEQQLLPPEKEGRKGPFLAEARPCLPAGRGSPLPWPSQVLRCRPAPGGSG